VSVVIAKTQIGQICNLCVSAEMGFLSPLVLNIGRLYEQSPETRVGASGLLSLADKLLMGRLMKVLSLLSKTEGESKRLYQVTTCFGSCLSTFFQTSRVHQ
jgi:hypothetical protein